MHDRAKGQPSVSGAVHKYTEHPVMSPRLWLKSKWLPVLLVCLMFLIELILFALLGDTPVNWAFAYPWIYPVIVGMVPMLVVGAAFSIKRMPLLFQLIVVGVSTLPFLCGTLAASKYVTPNCLGNLFCSVPVSSISFHEHRYLLEFHEISGEYYTLYQCHALAFGCHEIDYFPLWGSEPGDNTLSIDPATDTLNVIWARDGRIARSYSTADIVRLEQQRSP